MSELGKSKKGYGQTKRNSKFPRSSKRRSTNPHRLGGRRGRVEKKDDAVSTENVAVQTGGGAQTLRKGKLHGKRGENKRKGEKVAREVSERRFQLRRLLNTRPFNVLASLSPEKEKRGGKLKEEDLKKKLAAYDSAAMGLFFQSADARNDSRHQEEGKPQGVGGKKKKNGRFRPAKARKGGKNCTKGTCGSLKKKHCRPEATAMTRVSHQSPLRRGKLNTEMEKGIWLLGIYQRPGVPYGAGEPQGRLCSLAPKGKVKPPNSKKKGSREAIKNQGKVGCHRRPSKWTVVKEGGGKKNTFKMRGKQNELIL